MRVRRLAAGSAVVAAAVSFCIGAPAASAASSAAGCLGIGSSANAGYPRDRAVISHDVKDLAATAGVTPGAFISSSARDHLGSPEACFE